MAVIRDVVAGEDGKSGQTAFTAAVERLDQDPWRGVRFRRGLQIVNDPGVVQIQITGGGIDAITFLCDGERHNGDLRFTKFLNDGGQRIQFCVQTFMDGTDDNRLVSLRPFFQHGEEMILCAQLAHQHVAAEEANLTNTPVAAFLIQHPVC